MDVSRTKDILRIAMLLRCDIIGMMANTTTQATAKPPLNELGKPHPIRIR